MPDTTDLTPDEQLRQTAELIRQALSGAPPTVQMPQVQQPADSGGQLSLLGRIGEAIGGSAAGYVPMTTAQREQQGFNNLLNFAAAGAAAPYGGLGVSLGAGVRAAQQSAWGPLEAESQLTDLAQKQQQTRLENLKAATDLLNAQIGMRRLTGVAGLPSSLQGGGPGGPGGAPPSGPGGSLAVSGKDDFVQKFTPIAQAISAKTGLPVDYIIAQAGLETGWGTSSAAKNNNFFGITDPRTGKPASYDSPEAGTQAYIDLMASDRYKNVPRTGSLKDIGDAMAHAGYNPNVPKEGQQDSYGTRIAGFGANLAQPAGAPFRVAGQVVAPSTPAPVTPAPLAVSPTEGGIPVPPVPPATGPTSAQTRGPEVFQVSPTGQPMPDTTLSRSLSPVQLAAQLAGQPAAAPTTATPTPTTLAPAPAPAPAPQPQPQPQPAQQQPGGPPLFAYKPTTPPPGVIPSGDLTAPEQATVQKAYSAYNSAIQAAQFAADPGKARADAEATLQSTLDKELTARTGRTQEAASALKDWFDKDFEQQRGAYDKSLDSYYTGLTDERKARLASRQKLIDTVDANAESAGSALSQLQILQDLSKAAGPASLVPEAVRTWMINTGVATPEEVQHWSAQQALEAANNRLITSLRNGTGFQRTTNMDLGFLMHSSPGGAWTPEQYRDATTAFLLSSYRRTRDFANEVHKNLDAGMTIGDAQETADTKLGPIIRRVPSNADLTTQYPEEGGDKRGKWVFDNILPGEFYKDQSGKLRIFSPGDKRRPD